ncbi:MAG: PKD domain-containing protein [Cyclobacteriaceae bacterium]|nr:PKD domain-containing protein [Cyclobacteriaceae bacterium]
MQKAAVSVLFLVLTFRVLAQCPVAAFNAPSVACVQENILLENTSSGASEWEWDFCSGELELTPTASFVTASSSFFRARVFRLIRDENGLWFGFAIDQPNNLLVRFDFGTSLDNNPIVTSLGNPGSRLQNPLDMDFIREGNTWFALVANTGGNNLVRLNFGSSLSASPSATDLGTFGILNAPSGIDIISAGSATYAFVTVNSPEAVVLFSFGSSLNNAPSTTVYSVSGASGLRSISFIQECNEWFGLVTSYNTAAIHYVHFQNGLNNPPVIGQLALSGSSYSFPATVRLVNEGARYYAFVQSAFPAHVYRINFGESVTDLTGVYQNLGNLGISTDNGAFDIAGYNSLWRAFSIDLSGAIPGSGRLFRITFPETCAANMRSFSGSTPPVLRFTAGGTRRVSLAVKNTAGYTDYQSAEILVNAQQAPDIDFTIQNQCAQHPVNFFSQNTSGNIAGYQWDFGDSGTSALPDPSHIYLSAGTYPVQLQVTATNGCTNRVRKSVQVFSPPVPDFQLPPAAPFCTNQSYLFNNTSVFDAGSSITWNWLVNGVSVSVSQHLSTMFNQSVPHEIKLIAAIPGCSAEVVKNISAVAEGPLVNFSSSGQCQQSPVNFTNTTSGSVTTYTWNFGDGNNSNEVNPVHTFVTAGTFNVQLTAVNAAGCVNSKTLPITIYSRPQTDFSVALPPFSCSKTPTQFTDITPNPTDSNLASWFWDFNDGGVTSTVRNPQHTYLTAGTYRVALTVTTNFGCSASVQKDVQILPSPVPMFTYSPPCRSVPVQFNDVTSGSIQSRLWQIESTFYATQNPVHTFTTSGSKTITLTVTGTNSCVGSVTQNITVPNILVPDFMAERTCTNQQTVFTSLTNDTADPITGYSWNFGTAGTASGNPASATFTSTGTPSVSLTVITQTGCSYTRTKSITISAAPVASFQVSADAGGAPLTVNFTNTSTGATAYLWHFGDADGTTSTLPSPQFTYTQLGTYTAELKAFNSLGCLSKAVRTIHVVIPVLDVRLAQLELLTGAGGVIPAVTVRNNSNVPLVNPVIDYDLSGRSVIREVLPVTLVPNSSYRHVSSVLIPELPFVEYVCAAVLIDDVTPADNRHCSTLESSSLILQPFPNPVSRQQELIVSWTAASEGQAFIRLYALTGQEVFTEAVPSAQGYNAVRLNTSRLQEGMYLLRVQAGNRTISFRIQVIQ